MDAGDAVIQPRRGPSAPRIGSVAVLAATGPDLRLLQEVLGFEADTGRRLLNSRLYTASARHPDVCLVGPMVGAPYAVMSAETLIAWGATTLIFLGWCGAVAEGVAIGDLVLPISAFIDEGTSRCYLPGIGQSAPSHALAARLAEACAAAGEAFHRGPVWTTDAVFRETRDKVRGFQRRGALVVEMEASALFTLGAFRAVDVAALLVVSDDVSSLNWRPGFKEPRFARGRQAAADTMARFLAGPAGRPAATAGGICDEPGTAHEP